MLVKHARGPGNASNMANSISRVWPISIAKNRHHITLAAPYVEKPPNVGLLSGERLMAVAKPVGCTDLSLNPFNWRKAATFKLAM